MRSIARHVTRSVPAALVLALSLFVATPALAQPYPPPASIQCDKPTIAPTDFETCSADGFAAGASVTVTFTPPAGAFGAFAVGGVHAAAQTTLDVGTPTADADGRATQRFQIPAGTPNGPATVTFDGPGADGANRVASAEITIDSNLAVTGAEGVDRWALIALGLILAGAYVLLRARRRDAAGVPAGDGR